ncbi:MAG: hypothetical protein SFV17_25985 [Candidatus Obscuribacter sp.]|nr:hypothetical protein [Candidatus Obscuribacter sp.]
MMILIESSLLTSEKIQPALPSIKLSETSHNLKFFTTWQAKTKNYEPAHTRPLKPTLTSETERLNYKLNCEQLRQALNSFLKAAPSSHMVTIALVAILMSTAIVSTPVQAVTILEEARHWLKWPVGTEVTIETTATAKGRSTKPELRTYTLKQKSSNFVTVQFKEPGALPRTYTITNLPRTIEKTTLRDLAPASIKPLKLKEENVAVSVHRAKSRIFHCQVYKKTFRVPAPPNRVKWVYSTIEETIWKSVGKDSQEVRRSTKMTAHHNDPWRTETTSPADEWQLKALAVPLVIGGKTYLCNLEETSSLSKHTSERIWTTNETPLGYAKKVTNNPSLEITETVVAIKTNSTRSKILRSGKTTEI